MKHISKSETVFPIQTSCTGPRVTLPEDKLEGITIGQLATATGETVKTLRHWSDVGLLPSSRSHNRYRIFDSQVAGRVPTIRSAQHMGFTLGEIQNLLQACGDVGQTDCQDVHDQLEQQLLAVQEKMATLQKFATELQKRLEAAKTDPNPSCGSSGCSYLTPL